MALNIPQLFCAGIFHKVALSVNMCGCFMSLCTVGFKKRLWGATWGCEQKVKKLYSRKYWFWDVARVHLQCNGFVNLYHGPTKNHSSTSPSTTSHQTLQTEVTPGTVLPTHRTNQKVHILFLILPGGEEPHCHHNGLTGRQQWKNTVESKSLLGDLGSGLGQIAMGIESEPINHFLTLHCRLETGVGAQDSFLQWESFLRTHDSFKEVSLETMRDKQPIPGQCVTI